MNEKSEQFDDVPLEEESGHANRDSRNLAALHGQVPSAASDDALRSIAQAAPTQQDRQSMQPTYYVRHPDDSYTVADPQPCRLSALIHAKHCMAMFLGLQPDECIGGDFVEINDAIRAAEAA